MEEPVIYAGMCRSKSAAVRCVHISTYIVVCAGDLKDENRLLEWLMVQKDPHSDVIDEVNGEELKVLVDNTESVAVYFCEYLQGDHSVPLIYLGHQTGALSQEINF